MVTFAFICNIFITAAGRRLGLLTSGQNVGTVPASHAKQHLKEKAAGG